MLNERKKEDSKFFNMFLNEFYTKDFKIHAQRNFNSENQLK